MAVCVCPLFMPQEKKNMVSLKPQEPQICHFHLAPPPRPSFCIRPPVRHIVIAPPDREEIGIFIITHDRYLRKKTTRKKVDHIKNNPESSPPPKIKIRGIQVTGCWKKGRSGLITYCFSPAFVNLGCQEDMIQADLANKRRMPANVQEMGRGISSARKEKGRKAGLNPLSVWWCGLFQSSYVLCVCMCPVAVYVSYARFSHPMQTVQIKRIRLRGQKVK